MLAGLSARVVLATEGGIPASHHWAKLAVPIGIVVFIGSVYLLLRANLGTKRGYLVMSCCLYGFTLIHALFWAFGAPGTPQTTGPQNLPGQPADAYLPVWVAFAQDSNVADRPEYDIAKQYPDAFGDVPADFQERAEAGAEEIKNFFSSEQVRLLPLTYEVAEIRYAEADNGYPMLAVTYQETWQLDTATGELPEEAPPGAEVGALREDGETVVLFGFFDAGSPLFPSFVVIAITLLLFLVHAAWLAKDEALERQARSEPVAPETREPVATRG